MSIKELISWFFKKKGGQAENSPHKFDFQEKRRDPRIDLGTQDQLTASLTFLRSGEAGEALVGVVKNVSLRGCRLIISSDVQLRLVKPKQELTAILRGEGFEIPFLAEVARVWDNREMALSFKPPLPQLLDRLEKFLLPRYLGLSLREIDERSLKQASDKKFRWFQGVNDTHLFSWSDPVKKIITQQQLLFLEKIVEWNETGPLRTGSYRNDQSSSSGTFGWVLPEYLELDGQLNRDLINQAKVVMDSSAIDDVVKTEFLKHLT